MIYCWKFSVFISFLSIFLRLNLAENIIRGDEAIIQFDKYYTEVKEKNLQDKLHNLNNERKTAVCNYVLQDKNIKDIFNIFLNKNAIIKSENIFHWKENDVILQEFDKEYRLEMFPCYGRHQPVRTSWHKDDNYNKIFISGGPLDNSAFIFVCHLYPDSEKYELYGYIRNMNVQNLPQISLNTADLEIEEESLTEWSYNGDKREIEMLYIRNVVNVEDRKPDDIRIKYDICNLELNKKIKLCDAVLKYRAPSNLDRNVYWKPNLYLFNILLANCVSRKLHFNYAPKEFSNGDIKRDMFPCYGKNDSGSSTIDLTSNLYLSDGFRKNSILVYMRLDGNFSMFHEFLENIDIDNIENAEIDEKLKEYSFLSKNQ